MKHLSLWGFGNSDVREEKRMIPAVLPGTDALPDLTYQSSRPFQPEIS